MEQSFWYICWANKSYSMIYQGTANEYLELHEIAANENKLLQEHRPNELRILWCDSDNTELTIDGQDFCFEKNQLICLTEFHQLEVRNIQQVKLVRFNRPFYCVIEHDSEVGCKGILFFGATQLPVINIPEAEQEKFEILWKMFSIEMNSEDDLKLEMLKTMLKRLLILCTRLYKNQSSYTLLDSSNTDLVREFNFLVEQHYRSKHTVAEYAELLNRSPKTISNLFSKLGSKSPLQFIQERKMLEARRLLRYTDTPVKEIAYLIGFEDIQAFSRFFKNQEGISPSEFKEMNPMGKIANSSGNPA